MSTSKFYGAVNSFNRYGLKVIEMVNRKEPKAKFSMRFLVQCFGQSVTASIAAHTIIKAHQDKARKKRSK